MSEVGNISYILSPGDEASPGESEKEAGNIAAFQYFVKTLRFVMKN